MDRTIHMDESRRAAPQPPREPKVIALPPKDRVNMALAAIAGALLILVIVVGHDTFSRASGTVPSAAPAITAAPTATVPAAAPPAKGGAPGKGKAHD